MGEPVLFQLFVASTIPVVKIILICGIGAFCARKGLLTAEGRRVLGALSFLVFNPALIFVKLASTLTPARLLHWWPLVLNTGISTVVGLGLGYLGVRLVHPGHHLRPHTIVAIALGNLGNLPLVIVSSLAQSSAAVLHGIPPDRAEDLAVSYVVVGLLLPCIAHATIGFSMLRKPNTAVLPEPKDGDADGHTAAAASPRTVALAAVAAAAAAATAADAKAETPSEAPTDDPLGSPCFHAAEDSLVLQRRQQRQPLLLREAASCSSSSDRCSEPGLIMVVAHSSSSAAPSTASSLSGLQGCGAGVGVGVGAIGVCGVDKASGGAARTSEPDPHADGGGCDDRAPLLPLVLGHGCSSGPDAGGRHAGHACHLQVPETVPEGVGLLPPASAGARVSAAGLTRPAAEPAGLRALGCAVDCLGQDGAAGSGPPFHNGTGKGRPGCGLEDVVGAEPVGAEARVLVEPEAARSVVELPPLAGARVVAGRTGSFTRVLRSASDRHTLGHLTRSPSGRNFLLEWRHRVEWRQVGRQVLKEATSPPLLAILLSVPVGCVAPLQRAFFGGPDAPLALVTDCLAMLGDCTIPAILVILGATLANGPGAAAVPLRVISLVTAIRLALLPLLGLALVMGAYAARLFEAPDPIYLLVLLIQNTAPTAIMVHTMASVHGNRAEETSTILFWGYILGIAAIPMWLTLFLYVVKQDFRSVE